MSKKPVIAVDVDDVLAIENDAVRMFANKQYGHTHTAEDYLVPGEYWSYWEAVQGVDKEEGYRRYQEYLDSGAKAELQVMEGALSVLQRLKKRYRLIIVTSREAHLVDITKEWLTKHFPEVFDDVAFVAVWTGTVKGSKATVCKEIGAEYLIDDNIGHLELAAAAGIKGILFGDYGWSKNKTLPPDCVRLRNWSEVGEYFDAT